MRTPALIATLLGASFVPSLALAQDVADRVSFGSDVLVGRNEVVHDAVSFGGDTRIEGHVTGDAVSFGGRVEILEGGHVDGSLTSFGGAVSGEHHAGPSITPVHETVEVDSGGSSFGRWLDDTARSAAAHVLLFLLGVLLMAFGRERLRALQTTMIKDGLRTVGMGLMGYLGAGIAVIVLAITIVGIPVAILLAVALPIATYIGLASAATVIGAMLPIPQLKGNEVGQLAAGVALLFFASLVPTIGPVGTVIAACLGFGALIRTRFKAQLPHDLRRDRDDLGTRSLAV